MALGEQGCRADVAGERLACTWAPAWDWGPQCLDHLQAMEELWLGCEGGLDSTLRQFGPAVQRVVPSGVLSGEDSTAPAGQSLAPGWTLLSSFAERGVCLLARADPAPLAVGECPTVS